MDYNSKSKEDLIKELLENKETYESVIFQYEREIELLRLSEAKARKGEEKFRKAFFTNPDSVAINRLSDGLYISVNPSFTKTLGYSEEDVIGKTSLELNIWADPQKRQELFYLLQEQETVEDFEAVFRKKDGDVIIGLMAASLIYFDGVQHLLTITKNISKNKELEKALYQKQIELEAIIKYSPDQIFYKDRESKFLLCNMPVARLAGCKSEKELIGKSDFDFHPSEFAGQYFRDEQILMEKDMPILDHEEQILNNQTGELFWNLSSKVPVKNSDGNVIGLVGFNRDITKRKRIELENQVIYEITQGVATTSSLDELLSIIHKSLEKVVYAENCFVALHDMRTGLFSFPYFVDKIDTVPLPATIKKSCTAYVFRNGKTLLLTREIFDSLVEQEEVDVIGSEFSSWIGIPLKTPSRILGVLVLQHYEKENVYTDKDVQFLNSVGSQIALSIERKIAEEEIKLKNELLLSTNAEKDKFFSIIAHDLRSPLSAFVGATRILTEEANNMTIDEIREISLSMNSDATNVYTLLENLLEWSRLQRGVMEFKPARINLGRIIYTCVNAVTASANAKSIIVSTYIPDDVEIIVDVHMFETVIRNLVSNAVKFTPEGGRIIISAIRDSENYVITKIADTGIGMPSEFIGKLFKINENTNRPGTAGEPSSGLGLLLCNEFIEKHGGSISVESEEGKGSTFSVKIPGEIN